MVDRPAGTPRALNDFDRVLGLRIAALRKVRGMSRTALASAIGMSLQQVVKYESGRNRIGASRLSDLARALAVPVSDLLNDTADGQPSEVLALLAERGAIDVLRAFAGIEDAQLRRDVLAIVRSAARLGGAADQEAS